MRLLKWLAILAGLGIYGWFSYRVGIEYAQQTIADLSARSKELSAVNTRLREEVATAMMSASALNKEMAELRQRYEADVPTGPAKELLSILRIKLDEGVSLQRLASLLSNAQNQRVCDEQKVSRRFLLSTPINTAVGAVTFADNALTVTGEGASAVNAAGNPEAWFDPARPVTIRFAQIGGATSEAKGLLPLHHSVVIGDHEYGFSITASTRGFVNIAAERCRYP